MKNVLEGLTSRVRNAEDKINELKYEDQKNPKQQQKIDKSNKKTYKQMTIELWHNLNKNNIRNTGVPDIQKGKLYEEAIVKYMIVKMFPKLRVCVPQSQMPKLCQLKEKPQGIS